MHDLDDAVAFLRQGRLVAFATETVYGLGGDAENGAAVARIFAAKGRPSFNPLILHLAEAGWAERYATLSPAAMRVMAEFWPGPLTLVLPRRADAPCALLASAGLDTVALRVPAHPLAQALLQGFGRAIAAPSANRSGRLSPTRAAHVAQEFAGQAEPALILDGGPCAVGLESTVLDLTGPLPAILRPGAINAPMLRDVVADLDLHAVPSAIKAPGMLASHYAPGLPVRLDAMTPEAGEAFLAFGRYDGAALNLSPAGDLGEAAAHLFDHLRRLDDASAARAIAVMPIPEKGLGLAINDRLRRAAAPRAPGE